MALSWTYVKKLIRKLVRRIILDKIKRMIFLGTFYLGLLEIISQKYLFLFKKALLQTIFVSYFEVKIRNEQIAIKKIHTRFINAANCLISLKILEKWMEK